MIIDILMHVHVRNLYYYFKTKPWLRFEIVEDFQEFLKRSLENSLKFEEIHIHIDVFIKNRDTRCILQVQILSRYHCRERVKSER